MRDALRRSAVPAVVWLVVSLATAAGLYQYLWRTSVGLVDTLDGQPTRWLSLPGDGGSILQSLTVDVDRLDAVPPVPIIRETTFSLRLV